MRDIILNMLREHEIISGEVISRELNISRAAVAKHIKALRAEGYVIEAAPHNGYQLLSTPDVLSAAEISSRLQETPVWEIETYDELPSTDQRLRLRAEAGAPEFRVVIAESQTAGRGRLGRTWYSPANAGLWMSLLLRPELPPQAAQSVVLTAATAVAEALESQQIPVRLKWPNDVLAPDGRKVAGIRCELHTDAERMEWLTVGIGVNVNMLSFPLELRETACSLRQVAGTALHRADIAAAILDRMLINYRLLRLDLFSLIRLRWLSYAEGIGSKVAVSRGGSVEIGVAYDLDPDGYLLLKNENGVHRILVGDMSPYRES